MTTSPSRLAAAAAAVGLCLSMPAEAAESYASEQASFRLVTVASDFEGAWSVAFLPDGRYLVTEKPGALRIVSADGQKSDPLRGLPGIVERGQGGLLDVVLHPGFSDNQLIYFTFSGPGDGGVGTELARARLAESSLEDVEVLFRMEPKRSARQHFGSRLAFADDGTLYMSLGDRGRRDEAQNPRNHLGSVIRLADDGTIPADNPFADGAGGARPEIFSFGHRNVQGLTRHPETGVIWAHEHGPRGGDEVNVLKAGANYGWPVITYGTEYSGLAITDERARPGMEQPVLYWVPSIAPSGMAFYDGDRFPEWKGDLFVGALAGTHLRRVEIDGEREAGQEMLLTELGERIRDVRSGPDGYLYILTDGDGGRLIRLEPADG